MINFYKDKVILNCLAKDKDNAKEIFQAIKGHILIGVLSKCFKSTNDAVDYIDDLALEINNAVSIGLGAGDPNQSQMVSNISSKLKASPQHINQVFTGVGQSSFASPKSHINALVSPTGIIGKVKISTGPLSSKNKTIIDIEDAILIVKDMGGKSIKYFPMNGLETIDEFKEVAKKCAKHNFALEPTGGLNLENLETILKICIDQGVDKVIPHLYTSIIDKKTGKTKPEDVLKVYEIFKKLYG